MESTLSKLSMVGHMLLHWLCIHQAGRLYHMGSEVLMSI